MSLFDIFSTSAKAVDTLDKLALKAADGIGKLFYTDNEKAAAASAYYQGWLDLQKTLANESLPTAISRRILAWGITAIFCFLVLLGVFAWPFMPEWSKFIFTEGVSRLEFGFGAVVGTYFMKDVIVKAITANKS